MAIAKIRQALETTLDNINPSLQTSWENIDFNPTGGTPYQEAYLLPAEPENPEFGSSGYREHGIFQVTLKYPAGTGTVLAVARAELLQAAFARGTTHTKNGVVVNSYRTPEIMPYYIDGDRYCIPVRVRYFANI